MDPINPNDKAAAEERLLLALRADVDRARATNRETQQLVEEMRVLLRSHAQRIVAHLNEVRSLIGPTSPPAWHQHIQKGIESARAIELACGEGREYRPLLVEEQRAPLRRSVGPLVKGKPQLAVVRGEDEGPKGGAA